MCILAFLWVLNNWNRGYPKSCSLYMGYILLASAALFRLSRKRLASQRLKVPGWGDTQEAPPGQRRKEGVMREGVWEGLTRMEVVRGK